MKNINISVTKAMLQSAMRIYFTSFIF